MIVFRVRADPKPKDVVVLSDADRSVTASDTGRIDRTDRMDLPESKARMVGILLEERIRLPGMLSNFLWHAE